MAKAMKKRFSFESKTDLVPNLKGRDVQSLQSMLTAYGYLWGVFEVGKLCPATQSAVRHLQEFYGLKPDGVVGPITKKLLETPRCGIADLSSDPGETASSAPPKVRDCRHSENNLSYAFLNGTNDLTGDQERRIVRRAFQTWDAVADLSFTEVDPSNSPDFRIAWHSDSHGDGFPFDGRGGPEGNTLAHAFPPCRGRHAGDLHFDEAETWTDNPSERGTFLLQVAIHEIGHLLGLFHSNDRSSVMYAYYSPDLIELSSEDIQRITGLYGRR